MSCTMESTEIKVKLIGSAQVLKEEIEMSVPPEYTVNTIINYLTSNSDLLIDKEKTKIVLSNFKEEINDLDVMISELATYSELVLELDYKESKITNLKPIQEPQTRDALSPPSERIQETIEHKLSPVQSWINKNQINGVGPNMKKSKEPQKPKNVQQPPASSDNNLEKTESHISPDSHQKSETFDLLIKYDDFYDAIQIEVTLTVRFIDAYQNVHSLVVENLNLRLVAEQSKIGPKETLMIRRLLVAGQGRQGTKYTAFCQHDKRFEQILPKIQDRLVLKVSKDYPGGAQY